jgi:hypothetical protein
MINSGIYAYLREVATEIDRYDEEIEAGIASEVEDYECRGVIGNKMFALKVRQELAEDLIKSDML